MAILNNSNAISSGGYDINNSLRFRASASAYLSRTFSASGTTATFSVWIKRGTLGSYQTIFGWSNLSNTSFGIDLNLDTLAFYSYSSAFVLNLVTTQVLRDPSAWYHIVCVIDTTQATAANRAKIYINGSQVTALSTATYPSQNTSLNLATNTSWSIGRVASATTHYDGYMAEWNFIDGQALTPSSFGETDTTTGSWKPKAYTGTYGTNGFYLKFSDIATTSGSNAGLGKDFSGNTNYWNTNNISVTAGTTYDAMKDSPTNTSATVANYCVLNPLDKNATGVTISSANLKNTTSSLNVGVRGTMAVSSGKWYWETTITTATNVPQVGIATKDWGLTYVGSSNGVGYLANATKYVNGVGTSYGATFTTGDIIGVALDMDGGSITFYKNNVSQGSAATGLSGEYFPAVGGQVSDVTDTNFGQRPFSYTPPTGFVRLNTYNLPDSTIKKGNTVMDATLWTGNGTSQSIVNAGAFKPDFVWVKSRSNTFNNNLFNSTSGINKFLVSDTTAAEASVSGTLTAFNSNGFSVGSDIGLNYSGGTYVGWQWQAGQGSTSSNTSGSITSTVSVNTTAGFSVVTYTGTGANATVGHGLGVAPKMVIVKIRSGANDWFVWHTSLTSGAYYLNLNATSVQQSNSVVWNSTIPTSSVFSLGTSAAINGSGSTYVAYCWADVSGFSKAFSYTGNGSTDGSFVYVGFLPRFVMIKRTDTTGDWYMWDTARNTFDVITNTLLANSSAAETSATSIDALSNGFKLRNTTAGFNASGGTYIGMAWATNPFKNSNAF